MFHGASLRLASSATPPRELNLVGFFVAVGGFEANFHEVNLFVTGNEVLDERSDVGDSGVTVEGIVTDFKQDNVLEHEVEIDGLVVGCNVYVGNVVRQKQTWDKKGKSHHTTKVTGVWRRIKDILGSTWKVVRCWPSIRMISFSVSETVTP